MKAKATRRSKKGGTRSGRVLGLTDRSMGSVEDVVKSRAVRVDGLLCEGARLAGRGQAGDCCAVQFRGGLSCPGMPNHMQPLDRSRGISTPGQGRAVGQALECMGHRPR